MKNRFWDSASKYGLVHRVSAQSPGQSSEVLLVFVHGLFGDSLKTWKQMPEWVLQRSGVDVNVATFSYPSKLWQRTSLSQAADDLRTWMQIEFLDFRHIVFVTHSTGGLIVKQMLRKEFCEMRASMSAYDFDYSTSNLIRMRTRHIINISVPHQGGSALITLPTRWVYSLIYPLIAPLLLMTRFVTQGRWDWGWNDFLVSLRWKNPDLLELEEDFAEQQKIAATHDIPSPVLHDVYAKSDLSVPQTPVGQSRHLFVRGTHGSVKIPVQPSDPIVTLVAAMISRYGLDQALQLVDLTLQRIAKVNRATATHTLIETLPDDAERKQDQPLPTVSTAVHGGQTEICDKLIQQACAGSEQPRLMVVTGVAGVGKSVVLAKLAWRLGCRYLADPTAEVPFPLLIPLQQATLSDQAGSGASGKALWLWWARWTQSLYPNQLGNKAWLQEKLHHHAFTLILDGLDDFLVNHPSLGPSSVVNALRELTHQYAHNARLALIVGIRSGYPGLQRLAGDPRDIFEILPLSIAQAQQVFPRCKHWLPYVKSQGLLDYVLTPLILGNFDFDPSLGFDAKSLTHAVIMEQAIHTILRRSNLIRNLAVYGQGVEIDSLIIALALISWLFFTKRRGQIDTKQLRQEAKAERLLWERFLQRVGDAGEIIMGFRLVEKSDSCNAILRRTVFLSTGPNTVRFTHREWQEFLLAHYFALCIKWGRFENFGVTMFNCRIWRMAGDLLKETAMTEERMMTAINCWKQSGNGYILAQVIVFLSWSRIAIDVTALRLLISEMPNFDALSRLLLLAGLGYRILADDDWDPSLADLRRSLCPLLLAHSNPVTAPVNDPVVCSLAWCYQKAYARKFGMPSPQTPWPALGIDDADTLMALPLMCTLQDGKQLSDARSRALQLAFLAPVLEVPGDPLVTIRAIHYLYCLVVAVKYGVHTFELSQELPPLLEPACQLEKLIETFTLVPEVMQLYKNCQTIFRQSS